MARESWRRFENMARGAFSYFKRQGVPFAPIEEKEMLSGAHLADTLVADVATSIGVGAVGLDGLVKEMTRLLEDREIQRIYKEELWPEWFQTHKTINGYESWALHARAGRIAEERRRARLQEPNQ